MMKQQRIQKRNDNIFCTILHSFAQYVRTQCEKPTKKGNRTIEVAGQAGCKVKGRILNNPPSQHPVMAVISVFKPLNSPLFHCSFHPSIHPFNIFWAPCHSSCWEYRLSVVCW